LVIDEAHFLWPQRNMRKSSPRHIEWVRASLANYGVPVIMVATHQFTKAQQQVEKHTNWESAQLVGRIAFCAKLPDRLEPSDIEAVARFHLPEAEAHTISFLVDYVIASKKHLASIDHGVKAARHEARKAGRSAVTHKDVLIGFNNTVLPSDAALAHAGHVSPIGPRKSQRNASAATLQQPCETISKPLPERDRGESLTVKSERRFRRSAPTSLSTV
jgi:hypothetical protein